MMARPGGREFGSKAPEGLRPELQVGGTASRVRTPKAGAGWGLTDFRQAAQADRGPEISEAGAAQLAMEAKRRSEAAMGCAVERRWGHVVLGMVAGLFLWWWAWWTGSEGRRREAAEERAMYRAATNAVAARLVAPGSARFSGLRETRVDRLGGEVSGWVDAENVYGALVRSEWRCVVDGDGKVRRVEIRQRE